MRRFVPCADAGSRFPGAVGKGWKQGRALRLTQFGRQASQLREQSKAGRSMQPEPDCREPGPRLSAG
jgi:hypothetical protein